NNRGQLYPSNATLVANAVAEAQAAATSAGASSSSASASAASALASALAAAASASSVNLSLYLPKAGNLAGIGSPATARANIEAPKIDGSDLTGRLATTTDASVTDWNNAIASGWYSGGAGAANSPDAAQFWLVQTIAFGARTITQIAYNAGSANVSVEAVTPYRRHSYDNGSTIVWQPWQSMGPVPVGSTIWVNGITAPPGYIKENGALLSRATYPALYAYGAASGNMVSEASWSANSGAFSTGDLSTTFRIPDSRGEFIRGYDDGRGVDSGRVLGARQADDLKSHTHSVAGGTIGGTINGLSDGSNRGTPIAPAPISINSTGGTETRPRNIAKLACIKY
ncbi:tail fiber protein, partial [Bradyrhizobium liaoningense]|uniref:tail fiber protein n=1 Tax=Bradyrhizobium liaoningense TaxID=43992 RepID=UPI0012FE2BF6